MWDRNKNIRAFSVRCGLCNYPRRRIKTNAPVSEFKFVSYLICEWCDRGNKGKRRS